MRRVAFDKLRLSGTKESSSNHAHPEPVEGFRTTVDQIWMGLPVTPIAASLTASEWVGWAWQV